MDIGLSRLCRTVVPLSLSCGLLATTLLLQGCEPPSGPPGSVAGRAPTGQNMTMGATPGRVVAPAPAPAQQKESSQNTSTPKKTPGPEKSTQPENRVVGTLDKLDISGAVIELASSIVAENTNPFLNRLPKPLVAATDPTSQTPAEPSADPFENLTLMGIIYSAKNPIALLASGTEPAAIAKAGDLLNGGQIRVIKIKPDSVLLELVGVSKTQRTLTLPDIIGYRPAGGSGGSAKTGESTTVQPSSAEASSSNPLSNLAKLSGAPLGSTSSANVTLQEP